MPLGSAPVQPLPVPPPNEWAPYNDRVSFELAELLYTKEQMSATNIDTLLGLWEASQLEHNASPPFHNHRDLYSTIDATSQGKVAFEVLPTILRSSYAFYQVASIGRASLSIIKATSPTTLRRG